MWRAPAARILMAERATTVVPVATFAKPSAIFTNSLPSLFGLPSIQWLKTDAGPRDGKTEWRGVKRSNLPSCGPLLRAQGNRRIKNLRPAQVRKGRPVRVEAR